MLILTQFIALKSHNDVYTSTSFYRGLCSYERSGCLNLFIVQEDIE
jgi:hypothetical protein